MEDLKKNFILLSTVAREKKYAQEYLALLARRGDIGSIRIGKRWYTTWEWFDQFAKYTEKKKEQVAEQTAQAEKKEVDIQIVTEPVRESERIIVPEKQKEEKAHFQIEEKRKEVTVPKTRDGAFPIRIRSHEAIRMSAVPRIAQPVFSGDKIARVEARQFPKRIPVTFRPPALARSNSRPMEYPKTTNTIVRPEFSSPNFSENSVAKTSWSLFPRIALAGGFAVLFAFFSFSGYALFTSGFFEQGKVAGASDERNGQFLGIKSISGDYLDRAEGRIRESVSISKIIVESLREESENIDSEE